MKLEFKLHGTLIGVHVKKKYTEGSLKTLYTLDSMLIVEQGENETIFFPHLSSRVSEIFGSKVLDDMLNRPITLTGTSDIYEDDETKFFVENISLG